MFVVIYLCLDLLRPRLERTMEVNAENYSNTEKTERFTFFRGLFSPSCRFYFMKFIDRLK